MKKYIPAVIALAVIALAAIVVIKIIGGVAGLVASLFNAVLGIAVIAATVLIVLWMFSYAKKNRKK